MILATYLDFLLPPPHPPLASSPISEHHYALWLPSPVLWNEAQNYIARARSQHLCTWIWNRVQFRKYPLTWCCYHERQLPFQCSEIFLWHDETSYFQEDRFTAYTLISLSVSSLSPCLSSIYTSAFLRTSWHLVALTARKQGHKASTRGNVIRQRQETKSTQQWYTPILHFSWAALGTLCWALKETLLLIFILLCASVPSLFLSPALFHKSTAHCAALLPFVFLSIKSKTVMTG